ncbi:MAG: hypothetical protein ACERKO_09030 [Acetanaerobacterium sp.]
MIWFFNRKEVYTGFSMKEFVRVRDVLAANGIRYDHSVVDMSSRGRGTQSPLNASLAGAAFSKMGEQMMKQYYVYVHKNDYEQARHLL